MAAFRVFMYHPTPATEAIVATLRFGGIEVADEERPSAHEVILRYPPRDPRTTCASLVALLHRLHPLWRDLVSRSPMERTNPMTQLDRMEPCVLRLCPVAGEKWSAPAHLRGLPGWAR